MADRTADPMADIVKGEHNPLVNQQLQIAQILADEREDVLKRVGMNRDTLRNLAGMGYLSPEQAAAIEGFYPTRERKPRESKNGKDTFAAKEVAKNSEK